MKILIVDTGGEAGLLAVNHLAQMEQVGVVVVECEKKVSRFVKELVVPIVPYIQAAHEVVFEPTPLLNTNFDNRKKKHMKPQGNFTNQRRLLRQKRF